MRERGGGLAVVTGASSGIGRALAEALAARGQPVLAVARRAERLEALAAACAAAGGARVTPLALDVTAPGAPARIAARAAELGGARWLVNDAGTGLGGRVADADPDALARLVRLNCEAPVLLCRALLPQLRAAPPAVILNVGSLAAFQPTPFFAAYGASKVFVVSFTEGLAEELRGAGVTATAICPGPVTTEIFESFDRGRERRRPLHELDAATVARAAIAAADAGEVVRVVGAMNRLTALSTRLVPRAVLRRLSRSLALRYLGYAPPPGA